VAVAAVVVRRANSGSPAVTMAAGLQNELKSMFAKKRGRYENKGDEAWLPQPSDGAPPA
jgi:hypothetical protein